MCAIVGLIPSHHLQGKAPDVVAAMVQRLSRRGPDAHGIWSDHSHGIVLGHCRLAVIDLTEGGAQPMASSDGRLMISFNGEIYNYRELRTELEDEGTIFHGQSDTEVVLNAFARWGVDRTLPKLTGMFAIALWDTIRHQLTLARDRVGEKPLYYGELADGFCFASELSAFRALPHWQLDIDRNALALYIRHNYVPAPYSIFRKVKKLLPGHSITITRNADKLEVGSPLVYWSARNILADGKSNTLDADETTIVNSVQNTLTQIVSSQMVSDVPIGAFLSSGIDSSLVVAVMQSLKRKPVQTFTIGFADHHFDEAPYARKIADYLGTEHTELYVTPQHALNLIPNLPNIYAEPFADPSAIPTFLLAQLARSRVTVALSGDGGDELFGGYSRYFWTQEIWNRAGAVSPKLRQVAAALLTARSPTQWDSLFRLLYKLLPHRMAYTKPGEKLHKLASVLPCTSQEEMYNILMSYWTKPTELVLNADEPVTVLAQAEQWPEYDHPAELMMYLDLMTYLPDNNLAKLDRAAMANSLETRLPLVDHRLISLASSLPICSKLANRSGKVILKKLLERYLPHHLFDRQKIGFGVPVGAWLRGPLRAWAEALLHPDRLHHDQYFNVEQVRATWEEHLSGRFNRQYQIWSILMFQSWLDYQNE